MKLRTPLVLVGLVILSTHPFIRMQAQSGPPPQTYSATVVSALLGPPVTIKVSRDGSKELVDRNQPAAGGATASHTMQLYDFQAGTAFAWDVLDAKVPCGKSTTPDKAADYMSDPISGVAEWMKEIDTSKAKPAGAAVVNGIATKAMEMTDPASKTTVKLWLAEKGSYLIKYEMTPPGAAPRVMYEIKALSFEKPSASVFALPAACNGIAVNGSFTISGAAPAPAEAAAGASASAAASVPSPASSEAVMTVPIRINAGGPAQTTPDGIRWDADKGFSGGQAFAGMSAPVSGSRTPSLYQTIRFAKGDFDYSFNVANGKYIVTLKFAEIYYINPGQRVFSVAINGQPVLTQFDMIVAAGGSKKAIDKPFPVEVTNGRIAIHFTKIVDNPQINAIEIVKNP